MTPAGPVAGVGIGWRPELAIWIEREPSITFVEVIAENVDPTRVVDGPLARLRGRGVTVIPHGVGLSLGGAEPPAAARIDHLARLARQLEAPFVSEHIAFVRAGGIEAGHLLPIPRTRVALEVLADNVHRVQDRLPVPLVLENVAALFTWPDDAMSEGEFLHEVVRRTGVGLLLDVANVHANAWNTGRPATEILDSLPLEAVRYVHVAGGEVEDGIYHDTHAAPVGAEVLTLLEEVSARVALPGVLLERDDHFPPAGELARELAVIEAAVARGAVRRVALHAG